MTYIFTVLGFWYTVSTMLRTLVPVWPPEIHLTLRSLGVFHRPRVANIGRRIFPFGPESHVTSKKQTFFGPKQRWKLKVKFNCSSLEQLNLTLSFQL